MNGRLTPGRTLPRWFSLALVLSALVGPGFAGEWYVGNTAGGEWIQYTNVWLSAGSYRFTARAGATADNAMVHLEVDGVALKTGCPVPNTGRPDAFANLHLGGASLAQGYHTLRIVFESGGISLDWFMLHKDADTYNGVKAADIAMVRPPTNGTLYAPIVAYSHHTDVAGLPSTLCSQPLNDVKGGLYSDYQIRSWYGIPMFRDFERRTDRYWDIMVEQLVATRAQVPVVHCRFTPDLTNGLQDREYVGLNFEGRWLKKFAEAVARNSQAASSLKIGMFWENGEIANEFYKRYGYYPAYGDTALAEDCMHYWLEPWFDEVPADLLYQPLPGRPIIHIYSNRPSNIARDGRMGELFATIRNRIKAKYGLDPLFILPTGGDVDAAALAQAWGQAPWGSWDGPFVVTNYFNNAAWCISMCGSRKRLDTVWLNDWDPVSNTGTPGGDSAGHDRHQPRIDATGHSFYWDALNQARALGAKFVAEEGFYNIAEGNAIFRSDAGEWAYPNQHLATLREFADPATETLVFEAEGCDSYYKTVTDGNSGGSYRWEWYSSNYGNLDVYRPLHNLQPWVQKNTVPGNLVQLDAGFYDVWAVDAAGQLWSQQIDGEPDKWTLVTPTPPKPLACIASGKTYAWAIATNGSVYSCTRSYSSPTYTHRGWTQRSGNNWVQLDVGEVEVWAVNASGQVFRRLVDGSVGDWVQVPGTMDKVSVGDLFVWGIRGTNLYYSAASSAPVSWVSCQNPFGIVQIHVGLEEVWGLNGAGSIYRKSVSGAGDWEPVDGNLTKICVGENFAWGLSGTTPCSRRLEGFRWEGLPLAPLVLRPQVGDACATLSWVPSSSATGYQVKRATTSGGPYTVIAAPAGTSWGDSALANSSTYYYVVSALNASGESPNSTEMAVTPQAAPAVPVNFTVAPGTLGQLKLAWVNNAATAYGFKIERKMGADGLYKEVAWTFDSNVTTFSDTNLASGTAYYYRVRAYDTNGLNSSYIEANATTPGGLTLFINFQPASATPVPGYLVDSGLVYGNRTNGYTYGLSVDNSGQARERNLNFDQRLDTMLPMPSNSVWQIALSNGTYQVKVSVGDVGGTYVTTLNVEGINYWNGVSVGPACANLTRTVTVSDGQLTLDNGTAAANATRLDYIEITPLSVPQVPPGLSATAGNTQVSLSWNKAFIASSYNVKRAAVSGGPYTTLSSTTSTNFVDAGVANGTTYYYVVSAVNANGESVDSVELSVMPQNQNSTLYEAEGLNAFLSGAMVANGTPGYSGNAYADFVNSSGDYVEWTVNVASNCSATLTFGYCASGDRPLELKVNGTVVASRFSFPGTGGWNTPGTVSTNVSLLPGDNAIRLTAVGSSGNNIDYLKVTSPGTQRPAPPGDVRAVAGNARITLNWSPVLGASAYTVKRAATPGGPYTTVSARLSDTSFVDAGLSAFAGSACYYVVSAVNSGGASAYSAETAATPLPALPDAPSGVNASAGNSRVTLAWSPSAAAIGYNVKRAVNHGGPYVTVASLNGTSFTDAGLANGLTYYYVVSPVNAGGVGRESAEVNATPQGTPVTLRIDPLPKTQVSLSWTNDGVFKLHYASDITPSAVWTPVTNAPNLSNGHWSVTLPLGTNARFYRLKQ